MNRSTGQLLGSFLAFFAQTIAANIECLLGIEFGSENTQQIIGLIKTAPLIIIVTSIIGPILEEIVFRKIIFGSLHKRFNFFYRSLLALLSLLSHMGNRNIYSLFGNGLYFCFSLCKNKTYTRTHFCPCRHEYHRCDHAT